MLVLTVKEDEEIVVVGPGGKTLTIKAGQISGNQLRLKFHASKEDYKILAPHALKKILKNSHAKEGEKS